MTKITKKEIEKTIRTCDRKAIWRLVQQYHGSKIEAHNVFAFVSAYAPTNKLKAKAWDIAYAQRDKFEYSRIAILRSQEFKRKNKISVVLDAFRKNVAIKDSNYAKRPFIINNRLIFAHPYYREADYNRWEAFPVEYNERFCEIICKLADKIWK